MSSKVEIHGAGGGGGSSNPSTALGLVKAGDAVTATVINDATSTTNWSSTGSGAMATATIDGEACIGAGFRDGLFQNFRYDAPSTITIPASNLIRVRVAWDKNDASQNPSNFYEIVVSDGAGWTGNVVTLPLPAGMIELKFVDFILSVKSLTGIRCVGLRTRSSAYSVAGSGTINNLFYISEIDFPAENGIAIGRANDQSLVVPEDYVQSPIGSMFLDGIAARLDFKKNTIEGFRRVRHIRDFNFVNSGDVTVALQAIIGSLQPGDIFEFEPFEVYQVSSWQMDWSHLKNVTIRGNYAALQFTGLFNVGIIQIGRFAENVKIEKLRVFGNRETTTNGSTLTDAAANMARPEVSQSGIITIPVTSEWTAETNAGTPGIAGGVTLDSYPNAMQVAPSGAGSLTSVITATTRRYPVVVGVAYTATIAATSYRPSGGSPVSRVMSLDIVWYDSGGAVLSTTTGSTQSTSIANNSWVNLTVTGTAPASAVRMGIRINIQNPAASSERHYFDRMVVTRNTTPTNTIASTTKVLNSPGDAVLFPDHVDAAKHHFWARQPDGTNKWGVTISGSSAQTAAALFRVTDKRTGNVIHSQYIDVTTTPTLNYITWRPPDIEAPLMLSIQNAAIVTPITITVTSVYEYGRSDYNGGADNMSAFVVNGSAKNIRFEDIQVEGVYGEAVDVSGAKVDTVHVRNCLSRANGRQGMSFNRGRNIQVDGAHIIGCGRSGIDIEPFSADWRTKNILIANVRVAYTTNYAVAATNWHLIEGMSIVNLHAKDCGAGLIIGGAIGASFSNVIHDVTSLTNLTKDVTLLGQNMSGTIVAGYGVEIGTNTIEDGANAGKNIMADNGVLTTVYPSSCPNLHVVVNNGNIDQYHGMFKANTDEDGRKQMVHGALVDSGQNPPYNSSASNFYSGGIRIDDNNAPITGLDPGPFRRWFPNTYKGVIFRGLWFQGGLDVKSEPVIQVRGLSGNGIRSNNLRGIDVAVGTGATSLDVAFPGSGITHAGAIDSSVSAPTAGALATNTLVAGTVYRYKVGLIMEKGRGPQAPAATTPSFTYSGSNPIRINVKKLMVPEPDVDATGYMPYGFVIYRSANSTTDYTVRYTVLPTTDFPSIANNMFFYDYGDKLNPAVVSSITTWGFDSLYNAEAFTGLPVDESGWEPNASYAVIVTPSWSTTVSVTAKAASGFTVSFGTAAPAGGKVDWMIVR